MKTIVVAAQKGGSGKTTIALHLAVAAATNGRSVVVADADPQGSASLWGRLRGDDAPKVYAVEPLGIPALLEAARADRIGVVIIDTPPHNTPHASEIIRGASFVIVPVRPTILDLAAAESTAALILAAKRPGAFVLSQVPARCLEAVESPEILEGYGLPVAPIAIHERRTYARALAAGKAVTEYPGAQAAAAEMRALTRWILDQKGLAR